MERVESVGEDEEMRSEADTAGAGCWMIADTPHTQIIYTSMQKWAQDYTHRINCITSENMWII